MLSKLALLLLLAVSSAVQAATTFSVDPAVAIELSMAGSNDPETPPEE